MILCAPTEYGAWLDKCEAYTRRGIRQRYCNTHQRYHWPDQVQADCDMVPPGMCRVCEKEPAMRDRNGLCRLCVATMRRAAKGHRYR